MNGEVRQQGRVSEMAFPIAQLIAYISRIMTLEPGDVIATGTPAGVGISRDPQELDNLAGRPEYAAEEDRLRALLAEKYGLGARGLRPMYEACLARQKANRLITEALGRGRPESWKQGCTDSPADRRFVVTGDIFPDVDLASFVNAELIGE